MNEASCWLPSLLCRYGINPTHKTPAGHSNANSKRKALVTCASGFQKCKASCRFLGCLLKFNVTRGCYYGSCLMVSVKVQGCMSPWWHLNVGCANSAATHNEFQRHAEEHQNHFPSKYGFSLNDKPNLKGNKSQSLFRWLQLINFLHW